MESSFCIVQYIVIACATSTHTVRNVFGVSVQWRCVADGFYFLDAIYEGQFWWWQMGTRAQRIMRIYCHDKHQAYLTTMSTTLRCTLCAPMGMPSWTGWIITCVELSKHYAVCTPPEKHHTKINCRCVSASCNRPFQFGQNCHSMPDAAWWVASPFFHCLPYFCQLFIRCHGKIYASGDKQTKQCARTQQPQEIKDSNL